MLCARPDARRTRSPGVRARTRRRARFRYACRVSAFAALRERNFTLLILAGPLILTVAVLAQEVAIGYALYQRTRDPLALGLVGLAEALPYLAVALFGGAIADRVPRKRIILVSVSGVLAGSLALDLLMRHADALSDFALLGSVYGTIALVGFARGFYGPALSALRATLIPPPLYANASAWSSAFWQTGAILGPLLAGFLYAPVGLTGTLTTVVAMLAVSLVLFASITAPAQVAPGSGEPIFKAIGAGLAFVRGNRPLLYSISLDMMAVLFGGVVAILPAFAEDVLRAGPDALGWLRAAPSIGAVLTLLVLARHSPVKKLWRNLLLAVAGFGVATLVFALSTSFWLSCLALFFTGAFDSVSVVIRQYLLVSVPPDHLRGRVVAVNGLFVTCSNEIGAFESGAAARAFGLRNSVLIGATVTLLTVVWLRAKIGDLVAAERRGEVAA